MQADPIALAGLGLTMEDVRLALAASTVDQPKGSVNVGSKTALTVNSNDQLLHAADYQNLVISYVNGAPVRLHEVAHVYDGVENDRAAAWTDGVRSVLMIIRRQPGANIIETNDRVKALLLELAHVFAERRRGE